MSCTFTPTSLICQESTLSALPSINAHHPIRSSQHQMLITLSAPPSINAHHPISSSQHQMPITLSAPLSIKCPLHLVSSAICKIHSHPLFLPCLTTHFIRFCFYLLYLVKAALCWAKSIQALIIKKKPFLWHLLLRRKFPNGP